MQQHTNNNNKTLHYFCSNYMCNRNIKPIVDDNAENTLSELVGNLPGVWAPCLRCLISWTW